jgi:hypothetical protein
VISDQKWPETTPYNGRINRENVERRVTANPNREKIILRNVNKFRKIKRRESKFV